MPTTSGHEIDWSRRNICLALGAAGTGMSALTRILVESGQQVLAADANRTDGSQPMGVRSGSPSACGSGDWHHPLKWISWADVSAVEKAGLCVMSPAIPESAPLLQRVRQIGLPVLTLPQAVASIFADRSQICVAGTHGKSTTTALLSWILSQEVSSAGCFFGAELCAVSPPAVKGSGGAAGHRRGPVVIESCEFGHSFLHYQPQHAILTGIDSDHFDWFPSERDEDSAFRQLIERTSAEGILLVNGACRRSQGIVSAAGRQGQLFSVGPDRRKWHGQVLSAGNGRTTIRVTRDSCHLADFTLPLVGQHNMRNAVAAVGMAVELGVSVNSCAERLADFPGLQRRFELRGEYGGMLMLDDYAHHPTAVTTTLSAARQQFPGRRIRVLLEPHQVVRVQRYWHEFAQAAASADQVVVLPVFPARERVSTDTCRRLGEQLAATIDDLGTPACSVDGVESAASIVELTGEPDDLFLTMGAGNVHRIHDEVHRRFQRDTAA